MRASRERQIRRIERVQADEVRTHTFFRNPGETREAVQARIRG